MNDHRLVDWFDGAVPATAPDSLLDAVFEVTRRQRPMPAWRALLSVPVMRTPGVVVVGSPFVRAAGALLAVTLLAGLVTTGALIGSGVIRAPEVVPAPADEAERAPAYRLGLATERWSPLEPGATRVRSLQLASAEFAELYVTAPAAWSRMGIGTASDMVEFLTTTPRLDLMRMEPTSLGGIDATAIWARFVPPPGAGIGTEEAHYMTLAGILLDAAWQYRFTVADPAGPGWLVVTCGGDQTGWTEALQACDELLATWEWVD